MYIGGSTFVCEGDHPHLLKKNYTRKKKIYISNYFKLIYSLITLLENNVCIYIYIYIYIHLKKILYVKLTDFNYRNKNV